MSRCAHKNVYIGEVGAFTVQFEVRDGLVECVGETNPMETGEAFIECLDCGRKTHTRGVYTNRLPRWALRALHAVTLRETGAE